LSTISTATSEEGQAEQTLSKASRCVFNNSLADSDIKKLDSTKNSKEEIVHENNDCDMVPEDTEALPDQTMTGCAQGRPVRIPLSLHRVLASCLLGSDNLTEAMVEQLHMALDQSAQHISKSEDQSPRRISHLSRRSCGGGASHCSSSAGKLATRSLR
jgi:hypothetical protein